MLFFRQLVHLLPRGLAWRITSSKTLAKLLTAFSQGPSDIRDAIDLVWLDAFPDTTRELSRWESQFGLTTASTDSARRLQISTAWSAQGGQSLSYLEGIVRAAGFDVHLYEWWTLPETSPRVAHDPRSYTLRPELGTVQCRPNTDPTIPPYECTAVDAPPPVPIPSGVSVFDLYPECNRFLANDPGYLVNLNLTREAPPPVPDDPTRWPYFLYWMGATFGTHATIPASRRDEFERLLLKLCPAQQWLVTYVTYT
jgi:hypothetical protein